MMEGEIPREMLQEILVKLPTRDVARCSCVSRLWRGVVTDPSFHKLHAANYVAPLSDAEVLLVSHKDEPGSRPEATVFNVSSAKAMYCLSNSDGAYSLTNVCDGFLCFEPGFCEAPVLVCNPVSGEKLAVPKVPSLRTSEWLGKHLFALGFSPSTKEYKLFRLPFPRPSNVHSDSYVDVYTLGDTGGWRQHPYLSPQRPIDGSPPVLVDGKLYVVTSPPKLHNRPDRILEIDVASEAHRTYRLPDYEDPLGVVRVSTFELQGRLCLAVNTMDWHHPYLSKLQFWVMSPRRLEAKDNHQIYWDPCYSFYVDANITADRRLYNHCDNLTRGAWLDDEDMLCYTLGDTLYKYDTRGYSPCPSVGPSVGFLQWHQQLQLPATPSPSLTWNIYAGYRPTLLSPLTFALAPSQDDDGNGQQFEHALLRELRRHKPKRRPRAGHTHEQAA